MGVLVTPNHATSPERIDHGARPLLKSSPAYRNDGRHYAPTDGCEPRDHPEKDKEFFASPVWQSENIIKKHDRKSPSNLSAGFAILGAGLALFIVHGITWSSGILYVVFLDAFNQSRAETAWIGSLLAACGFAASPISSILVNRYGCRLVVILSGFIVAVGMCASTFANNVYVLYFTYGVVAGAGCGFVYVPANVIVSRYFKRRRTIALGVSTCCGGLGSFAFPPLLEVLLNNYGWRGTFLILGGLSLNMCVAGAMLRPPPESEEKISIRAKRDIHIFKKSSYHILCWNNVLFCFATSIVYVHLGSFAKITLGVTDSQSSILFSMIGVFTFIGRFVFGVLAQFRYLKPITIYTIFFLTGGVGTLWIPSMTSFNWLIFYSAVFGLAFAALGGALLPSILIDIAGLESLSFSYGVLILYESVGQVLGAPVAGRLLESMNVRDKTVIEVNIQASDPTF